MEVQDELIGNQPTVNLDPPTEDKTYVSPNYQKFTSPHYTKLTNKCVHLDAS